MLIPNVMVHKKLLSMVLFMKRITLFSQRIFSPWKFMLKEIMERSFEHTQMNNTSVGQSCW